MINNWIRYERNKKLILMTKCPSERKLQKIKRKSSTNCSKNRSWTKKKKKRKKRSWNKRKKNEKKRKERKKYCGSGEMGRRHHWKEKKKKRKKIPKRITWKMFGIIQINEEKEKSQRDKIDRWGGEK